MNDHSMLLAAHKQLDYDCRNRNGRLFVSDWYCDHPFVREVIGDHSAQGMLAQDFIPYRFQNDNHNLHTLISQFHYSRGETAPSIDRIFITAGLSPLIAAQMIMLKRAGYSRLGYIKPLYYTYYFLAETLGIELVPMSIDMQMGFRNSSNLEKVGNLPLLFCDPVWFAGKPLSQDTIGEIAKWQQDTGNLVFIDGAFQYLKWQKIYEPEHTSILDPNLTFRNCCPTKSTATHGIRFAYSLVPPDWREELRYCYANIAGSGSYADIQIASSMMNWLLKPESNRPLIDLIQRRHDFLIQKEIIDDPIKSEAAYFSFIKIHIPPEKLIVMDQIFFDTSGYEGFVRLNSLLPKGDFRTLLSIANCDLTIEEESRLGLR